MSIKIPVGNGIYAVVDACDWDLLALNWSLVGGYPSRGSGKRGNFQYMHHVIWKRMHSEDLPSRIDHADRDSLNNCRSNLRAATNSQNNANAIKRKGCRTNSKGVAYTYGKYQAKITVNSKQIHLGTFLTEKQASEAYFLAAQKYFGEFARQG